MSDLTNNVVPHSRVRSLRDAIRKVRLGEVERSDVVVELQDTERARLEMLSEELQDVFREVPEDDDQFSFQIIPGATPRLWIDVTSHVVVGGDRRTYRFLKDTRLGRVTILETHDIDDMADCITEYIAERILERERALEGDWLNNRLRAAAPTGAGLSKLKERAEEEAAAAAAAAAVPPAKPEVAQHTPLWASMLLAFVIGVLLGGAALVAYTWFTHSLG